MAITVSTPIIAAAGAAGVSGAATFRAAEDSAQHRGGNHCVYHPRAQRLPHHLPRRFHLYGSLLRNIDPSF